MAARKRSVRNTAKKPVPARRSPTPRGVGREGKGAKGRAVGKAKRPNAAADADFEPLAYARALIRAIKNFPQPGILFRDITPLLADPKGLHIVLDAFAARFIGEGVDAVVGIESRGFIFGGALAARLNCSFVPVRKAGKLPHRTDRVSYSLEYGEAELEMHRDALREGDRVLVIDDLLATGGTAAAAGELVHRQGATVAAFAFVVELDSLNGRDRLAPLPVISLLHYD